MLDTCEAYGKEWCLSYNPSKSKVVIFGSSRNFPSLKMYGKELSFADELNYLGVTVVAGSSFSSSHVKPLIRFRSSVNAILNVPTRSSEPMLMKLLYSICVPHLTYSCEVISYASRQMQPLNVAMNDSIRRIFGYNRWESVRHLRTSFCYPSIEEMFASRSRKFHSRLTSISNLTLHRLAELDLH